MNCSDGRPPNITSCDKVLVFKNESVIRIDENDNLIMDYEYAISPDE